MKNFLKILNNETQLVNHAHVKKGCLTISFFFSFERKENLIQNLRRRNEK